MKPNYTDFGLSSPMSLELRKIVEKQLLEDLVFYGVTVNDLYFDWSGSCIEGHLSSYLNSSLENYSGITVYDSNDTIIAEGWMDYVNGIEHKTGSDFFIAFWDSVSVWENDQIIVEKKGFGIPKHIHNILPEELKKKL